MIFDKAFRSSSELKGKEAGVEEENSGTKSERLSLEQLIEAFGLQGVKPKHLSEATYYACLKVLSESVGKLPLKLNQTSEAMGTEARPDHPLFRVCRYRPNPFESASSFWTALEQMRNHYGNAYAVIQTIAGETRLWRLPSDRVDIWWDNKLLISETPHLWYRYTGPNGKRYLYSEEEILHFKTWLTLDGVKGLAVRDILKLTLDGSLESQQMLNRLYSNGMTGKAVVQYTGDLNDDLEKRFVRGLQDYVDGKVDGANSLIPVPFGASVQPLNIKLADSQFVDLRKYTALQIAAAMGVKPDQINDYTKSSYSSSEAQQIAFLVDTLLWILEHYEQEVSYKLLSAKDVSAGYAFKFNSGALLRTTTDKQIDSLAKGVAGMIYTPNDARGHLDMSHLPGGDRLYSANGSVIPLELAGAQYTGKEGDTTNE